METFRSHPVHTVEVRIAGRTYRVVLPLAPERLLDEPRTAERFRHNEYIPYWAQLWPGARMLAAFIAERVADHTVPAAARTLELGCGLGLAGLVAADLGLNVTLSDYDDDALAFAEHNAAVNGIPNLRFQALDWTVPAAELRAMFAGLSLDVMLAADALYEARNHVPLARCLAALLAPGGVAWLSDPGRNVADAFPEAAADAGLLCDSVPFTTAGDTEIIRGRVFSVRPRVR
jgi:predicted nicotinamide N-methyase